MPKVTKERRKLPQVEAEEQSYRSLVENIQDYAIFMMDKTGDITSWDKGACELFGYTRDEIVGSSFSVLFTKENRKKKLPESDMATAIQEGKHLDEREYLQKDGKKFWSSGVLTSSRDKTGSHQGFSKVMRDVTQQTNLHRTAVHNSTHDFLTGLPNRSFFEERILEVTSDAKKDEVLATFYMDFNNFKRTNDELGHRYGDLVLIQIAHRLSRCTRRSDFVAQFGGDEFVILARGMKKKEDVARFAEKIIAAFKKPIAVEKKKIRTSVSLGVALYPKDGTKPSELLRFADLALNQAKKRGGNGYCFYDKRSGGKAGSKTRVDPGAVVPAPAAPSD